jgi:hypothetical protein
VKSAGIRARTTPYISFLVVSFPCECGDRDILSRLLISMVM